MTKVLHVITGLGRGGAPTMLYRLVEALSPKSGYAHEIVSLLEKDRFDHDFDRLGVPLHALDIRHPTLAAGAIMRLRRLVKDADPDVVQGWMYHANVAAALSAPGRAPVVWDVQHSLHDLKRERLLTQAAIRLGPILARRVARIVYCSETSEAQHRGIGYPGDRSVFIPNGVDTEVFRPDQEAARAQRATMALPDGAVLIGHAARYHPMKNHRGLVRAFAAIAPRFPEARLVMVGRRVDEDNEELVAEVRESGMEGRVLLLGEHSDMPRLLRAFDLYVSSSSWGEAWPVVLCEAMASGLPCVTTHVGDSATLVGETGRVTPAGDEAALAKAIGELLALSPERRRALGGRARERVIERYSLSSVAEAYASLYRTVCGDG